MAEPSTTYEPRQPSQGTLYQIVRDHFETFRAQAASLRDGEGLPRFVEQEFRDFLQCGWLAGGALALAERSVTLTGQRDAAALDSLAAALAANGQFERAAATVERALALLGADANSSRTPAAQAGEDIARMRARLNLYLSRQPYIEAP